MAYAYMHIIVSSACSSNRSHVCVCMREVHDNCACMHAGYFPPTCSSPAARPRTSLDHNTSSASPKQYNGPSGSPCLSPYPQRASFDASGQACVSGRESRQSIGSGALTGHGMHAAGGVAPRDSYHSERVTGVVAGRALDLLVALPVQQLQAGLHGLVWR